MKRVILLLVALLLWVASLAQQARSGFIRYPLPEVGYIDLPQRFQAASAAVRQTIDAPTGDTLSATTDSSSLLNDYLFVTERLNRGQQREPDTYVMFRIETSPEEPGGVYRLQDTIAFTDEELLQFDASCREGTEHLLAGIGARIVSWHGVQIASPGRVRYECVYQVPGEVEFQLICILHFNYDRTHTLTVSGPRSAIARDASALEAAMASFTITHER